MAAAALEALEPGAAIVFISSAASLRAATWIPAYDASKAALLGICRQVAREGMARGIRANLVVPGLVDTPLGREAFRLNPARTARRRPFGRQATAWEVAYATAWLLSGEFNALSLTTDRPSRILCFINSDFLYFAGISQFPCFKLPTVCRGRI